MCVCVSLWLFCSLVGSDDYVHMVGGKRRENVCVFRVWAVWVVSVWAVFALVLYVCVCALLSFFVYACIVQVLYASVRA